VPLLTLHQVCCAIAPTFFSATCYVMFGLITLALGTEYSRLKPKKYALVFVLVDIFSLVLQGIGGGSAFQLRLPGPADLLQCLDLRLAEAAPVSRQVAISTWPASASSWHACWASAG
jgi:hypothetical protein